MNITQFMDGVRLLGLPKAMREKVAVLAHHLSQEEQSGLYDDLQQEVVEYQNKVAEEEMMLRGQEELLLQAERHLHAAEQSQSDEGDVESLSGIEDQIKHL